MTLRSTVNTVDFFVLFFGRYAEVLYYERSVNNRDVDAFLIVIAILSAVVLLFRCAVPPRKLKRSACELLSEKAMLYRIETLAKRCASVGRGFGAYYRDVKLDKLLNDISKKPEWEEWEISLLYNRADILEAFKKGRSAMRLSYTLGAVGGYPRLYLLCDAIVKYTEGNIDVSALKKAVAIFDKHAALVEAERVEFTDMLRFCQAHVRCGSDCAKTQRRVSQRSVRRQCG